MRKTIQLILVILAVTSCSNYEKQKEGLEIKNPAYTTKLDSRFRGNNNNKRQGYGVLIMNNGEVEHAVGYGMANMEKKLAITPKTKFYNWLLFEYTIVIKTYQEWEAGNLDLDSSIREFLPEAPERFQDIRVADLLNRTSGLGTIDQKGFKNFVENSEVIKRIYEKTEVINPGYTSGFNGSFAEFMLLQEIIEKITGRRAVDIANEMYKEFGLESSFVQIHEEGNLSDLLWYKRRGKKQIPVYYDGWFLLGGGTTITTLEDMAKFFAGIDTKKTISEEVYNQLFTTSKHRDGSDAIDQNNQWTEYTTASFATMGYKTVPTEKSDRQYVSIANGNDWAATKYFPESNRRIFLISNLSDAKAFDTIWNKVEPVLFPN